MAAVSWRGIAPVRSAGPQSANINAIVESTLAMFNGRLDNIRVRTSLSSELPNVMADPEAIKRALANLLDNAAEAMQDALFREIQISTALAASRDVVEVTVADTGVDHALAVDREGVRVVTAGDLSADGQVFLDVLHGQDRRARGDAADQR